MKLKEQDQERHNLCEFIKTIHFTEFDQDIEYNLELFSKFYRNSIVLYYQVDDPNFVREINPNSLKNLNLKHTRGDLQPKSCRRIARLCEVWFDIIEFNNISVCKKKAFGQKQLSFITLTLSSPQQHTDQEIKRQCLNSFLSALKFKYNGIHHIWKAEKQKNGNIHFHLIVDKYVDKYWLQLKWNQAQDKLNYIQRYTQNTQKVNPPSTQIERVWDANGMKQYLIKYILKTNSDHSVNGRKVGMSNEIRHLKPYTHKWTKQESFILLSILTTLSCDIIATDYCYIITFHSIKSVLEPLRTISENIETLKSEQCRLLYPDHFPKIPGQ